MSDAQGNLQHIARVAVAQVVLIAFVAAVSTATVAVSSQLGWHGRPPVGALLLAAAVVTIALPRVRPAADRLANWVVLRDRADSYDLVSDFVRKVASTLPVEEVLPRLAETAARSVRSPRGEVRVWLTDGDEWTEAWPVDQPDGAAAVDVDVRHDGQSVGELEVSMSDEEVDAAAARRRLRALAGPAGVALSTVRLTVDLRQRLDELARTDDQLRASHRRLIEGRLEERQRFVRTIDEFVRPHLTATGMALADVGGGSAEDLESGLATAARHGEVALEHLRSLAHGVFPVMLLQAGVGEALAAWADSSEVALRVRAWGDPGLARRAPTAAAVQYFACVDALQGLRPAPSAATVQLSQDAGAGTATLTVEWDAVTSARMDPNTALRLHDRAEAVGGTVEFSKTRLTVTVPAGPQS